MGRLNLCGVLKNAIFDDYICSLKLLLVQEHIFLQLDEILSNNSKEIQNIRLIPFDIRFHSLNQLLQMF